MQEGDQKHKINFSWPKVSCMFWILALMLNYKRKFPTNSMYNTIEGIWGTKVILQLINMCPIATLYIILSLCIFTNIIVPYFLIIIQ